MRAFIFALCVCAALAIPAPLNGVPWLDDEGHVIHAHGGGFMLHNGVYYWYGETDKGQPDNVHGVNCYSSKNLITWHFEGEILTQATITYQKPGPYRVERPKVVYNAKTKLFVMYFHLDTIQFSYQDVGVAVSPIPNGPFKFVKGFQPDGQASYDMGLYQDSDGSAYLVRAVNNQKVGISQLSDDYMNTTGITSQIDESREGPAIFFYKGNYYLITSHETGWAPNAMEMFVAAPPLKTATWKSLGNPTGSWNTFNTQSTAVTIFNGTIIYQGDRWNQGGPGGLAAASYVWLPMIPDGNGSFKIEWRASWTSATTEAWVDSGIQNEGLEIQTLRF